MTDMQQMFSALANMSERQQANLTEMRLQTVHQEHIARQSENVALVLSVLAKLLVPAESNAEALPLLDSLVLDFRRESMQWREHVERLTGTDEPTKDESPPKTADRMQLQSDEFDTCAALAEEYRRITCTPVVDDDYIEVRAGYELALGRFIAALKANGRIP